MAKNNLIAFQGSAGAYSDMACRSMFPGRETLPCPSFDEAFRAVREKKAELAMIPVDNTLAGRVADVHHLLPDGGLFIIGEHFEPIRHALLGVKGAKLEDVKHVHSHAHAIPQCRKIIKQLKLKTHVGSDTAGAAKDIAARGDKEHAAIASILAGDIYGLKILKSDVQDADHNTTRFLVLSREHTAPAYRENTSYLTSLFFRVRNIPAALYKAMGGFATNGLSMAKLESYVDPTFQVAQFYAEVEGHAGSMPFRLALEELNFFADEVKILGTYQAHEFRRRPEKIVKLKKAKGA
jgi:prephenate dehydratase